MEASEARLLICPICVRPIWPEQRTLTHEGQPAHSDCHLLVLDRITTAQQVRSLALRQRAALACATAERVRISAGQWRRARMTWTPAGSGGAFDRPAAGLGSPP